MSARQLAWLGGAIKGADGKPTQTSRAQQIQADGGIIQMPELALPHLLHILKEAGLCLQGAMGVVPLTSAELLAWCAGAGRRLAAWEFSAILNASRAYCSQLHGQQNESAPAPPFGGIGDLSDPAVIGQRIAKSLGNLARPVKRKKAK